MNETAKIVLMIIIFCVIIGAIIGLDFYQNSLNREGLEIINHPLFIGEVRAKETMPQLGFTFPGRPVYIMHIVGGYYPDEDTYKSIYFDRRLSVSKDMYDSYEVGDFISNQEK